MEQQVIYTPTAEDWGRVDIARALIAETVAIVGKAEAVIIEGICLLCAKEEGWDEMESARVIALCMGNATPDNISFTMLPF